jgi:hypothetical protein
MVTVPVTVLLSVLNMSLKHYCIILSKIDVSRNLDKGEPVGSQAGGVFNGDNVSFLMMVVGVLRDQNHCMEIFLGVL